MIDCHSHIIPNIDDGAESVEMAMEMLKQSAKHGVTDIISTSHCYPRYAQSIDHFLEKRTNGFEMLKDAIKESNIDVPRIHLGSEVNMITDIAEFSNISKLCIEDTKYILIEMPYTPWKEWMFDSVYRLTLMGLKPIMAHIDRFLFQDKALLDTLFELDVLYQVNAELFLAKNVSKFANDLLTSGHAHLLGTDMHNLSDRKTTMDAVYENIMKRYGQGCIDYFNENARCVLNDEPIANFYFKMPEKRSFFSKLFKK